MTDPTSARKVVRGLTLPRQSRLHMVRENPARKAQIVAALVALDVTATIYDAGRRHPSELAARAACLRALIEDQAGMATSVTIEQDDGMVSHDNQAFIDLTRATGQRDTLRYEHQRAVAEPLCALPDMIAWCWTKGGDWRERITSTLDAIRTV